MKAIQYITVTAAAAALLAFSMPQPALSQMTEHREGHGHMMEMGTMDHMDHMGDMSAMCLEHADKIGLSDEQKLKMNSIHRSMQKKQVRFKADRKIAEIELMEIMEVKDFDLEKAGTAVKKTAEMKTAHHMEMLKAMKEMRSMLTDDQFKSMKKMMAMKKDMKKTSKRTMKKHQQ
ncbi:MAG: hypothetical protein IPQ16_03745 [Geobacteraceae bacterium]|nr:hypothetical protein [Geobacteraceae bacterium]